MALEGCGLKTIMSAFGAFVLSLVVCGVVHAQPIGVPPDLLTAHLKQPAVGVVLQSRLTEKSLELIRHKAVFEVAYAYPGTPRIPGVARTSLDRKLASDDVTGSLGFLCGLEPGSGNKGIAAARGYDPSGRFVGAKLRLAFR